MAEVSWTDQALQDVDNIAEYIAKDSRHFATIQVNLFFEHVQILTEKPLAGRVVPEFHIKSIREIIVGNYRVVYRVRAAVVEVLTIHHAARLLTRKSIRPK